MGEVGYNIIQAFTQYGAYVFVGFYILAIVLACIDSLENAIPNKEDRHDEDRHRAVRGV